LLNPPVVSERLIGEAEVGQHPRPPDCGEKFPKFFSAYARG